MRRPSRTPGTWRRRLIAAVGVACLGGAAAFAVSIDGPAGRVTVAHQTQVKLEVRLIRHAPEETRTLREETLEGPAGRLLSLDADTALGG